MDDIYYSGVKQDSTSMILIRLSTSIGDNNDPFVRSVVSTCFFVGRDNSMMRTDADCEAVCDISRYT